MDELEKLREDFKDHSANDERNFKELRDEIRKGFEIVNEGLKVMGERQAPLDDAYKGTIFVKNFITGAAGIVLALAAIGAGIIWIINVSIHR